MEENKSEFNMVTDTLARLGDTLRLDNPEYISLGRGQHRKIKLVKDLFLQSIPLLDKKDIERFNNVLRGIHYFYGVYGTANGKEFRKPRYNTEVEEELNNFLIDLQVALQTNGFFIPSKQGELL